MARPKLLDLFCGAGGASAGYDAAGFDVTGVDIKPQVRYPFRFIEADALTFPLEGYEVVHASPPCQAYSQARHMRGYEHPDLIPPTRKRLQAWGGPWIMENVPGSPLETFITLCGLALGLNVKRHRWFESNVAFLVPGCPRKHPGDWVSVFGHAVFGRGRAAGKTKGGHNSISRPHLGLQLGQESMGIGWMTMRELSEAIPPAYTEFLGGQLIGSLRSAAD